MIEIGIRRRGPGESRGRAAAGTTRKTARRIRRHPIGNGFGRERRRSIAGRIADRTSAHAACKGKIRSGIASIHSTHRQIQLRGIRVDGHGRRR